MSQQQDNAQPTDELADDDKQALSVLRGVWDAQEQTSADIDESCGNTKSCKSMSNVGFDGLADDDETPTDDSHAVGNNVRSAWKNQLEREGKLDSDARTVRDLVFKSEPKQ